MNERDDSEWLRQKRRIQDAVSAVLDYQTPKFIGFFDEYRERAAATRLKGEHISFAFYGGYDGAERKFLGIYPKGRQIHEKDFPIERLDYTYSHRLTHRDFLGAILALGLERNVVGDILVHGDKASVFIMGRFAGFLQDHLVRVGKSNIRKAAFANGTLPFAHSFEEYGDTISSARLDCVVASLLRCSRAEAYGYIEKGFVRICHVTAEKRDRNVAQGDLISIMGHGRFRVIAIGPLTKKGRLVFRYDKYV